MLKIRDLEAAMERIAPSALAEDWDNVGLLAGERERPLRRIMLCIDLREQVLKEAIGNKADAIVAYHPPIFRPVKRFDDRTSEGRVILGALAAGIAIHSPHTAADAAEGGVNDWLTEAFGSGERRPLTPCSEPGSKNQFKVVTFCPTTATDAIRKAMAATGAGEIGDYTSCSFQFPGNGTFLGGEGSSPTIGERGRLERVEEQCLGMICSAKNLSAAVAALRAAHPYEEPPVEIHPLEPTPSANRGAGRILELEKPLAFNALAEKLREHLGTRRMTGHDPVSRRRHQRIGFCAGSGGELLPTAIAEGCTLFVTGELKHHDVLAAEAAGCAVLLPGHTNTERGWLKVLRRRLPAELKNFGRSKVAVTTSRKDVDLLDSM